MRFGIAFFLLFVFSTFNLCSQSSTTYYEDNTLVVGLYKNYEEFLYNEPSIQDELIRKADAVYLWDDNLQKEVKVEPETVWGYSYNNNIYVSYNNVFWKLISKGKLNHFSIIVNNYLGLDPLGIYTNKSGKDFLFHGFFDIEDGYIKELTRINLKAYFDKDPKLKKYYRKLKGSKEDKLIHILRVINESNPIALPYKK